MLRQLPRRHDPNLVIGDNPADDAGVYRLSDTLALVESIDFFTPVVDDPITFGRIAVANALSDVYALGACPRTALNVVGFPIGAIPLDVLSLILAGGAEKAAEAGVTIVGGHTVDNPEPLYGLAVTGTLHPDRIVTARHARPGDVLVLTKPLGTGVITTAHKAGAAREADLEQAVQWMVTLNAEASAAMMETGVSAATDITGFGLLGHLLDLCTASGVSAEIHAPAVPLLPFARRYARAGHVPGGTRTNLEQLSDRVTFEDVDDDLRLLLADPQTSGGLLLSLPADRLESLRRAGGARMLTVPIGSVAPFGRPQIRVLGH